MEAKDKQNNGENTRTTFIEKHNISERINNNINEIADIQAELTEKIVRILTGQLESSFIEGLARKGHRFNSEELLREFIDKHCHCVDDKKVGQRTYFVKGVPFMVHNYRPDLSFELQLKFESPTMTANYGSFSFL